MTWLIITDTVELSLYLSLSLFYCCLFLSIYLSILQGIWLFRKIKLSLFILFIDDMVDCCGHGGIILYLSLSLFYLSFIFVYLFIYSLGRSICLCILFIDDMVDCGHSGVIVHPWSLFLWLMYFFVNLSIYFSRHVAGGGHCDTKAEASLRLRHTGVRRHHGPLLRGHHHLHPGEWGTQHIKKKHILFHFLSNKLHEDREGCVSVKGMYSFTLPAASYVKMGKVLGLILILILYIHLAQAGILNPDNSWHQIWSVKWVVTVSFVLNPHSFHLCLSV